MAIHTAGRTHCVHGTQRRVHRHKSLCTHHCVQCTRARPCLRGPARERRRSNLLITTGRAECLTGRAGPDILGPPRPAQDTLC